MSRTSCLFAITMVALVGAVQSKQALSPQRAQKAIAATTLTAARDGNVGAFARALAREGEPAGVIATRQALRPQASTLRPSVPATPTARMGEAVAAFAEKHAAYRVSESNDALLISPEGSPCLVPLRRRVLDIRLDGEVFQVGYELARLVNTGPPGAPPGLIGGRPDSLMRRKVSLYFAERTLKELLDEVARQVPGVVWGVVDDISPRTGKQQCVLHWFLRDGEAATSYDLLGPPGR